MLLGQVGATDDDDSSVACSQQQLRIALQPVVANNTCQDQAAAY
jgi:hypothetical protein